VFLIPSEYVKNGEERLVVLNRVARSVIESCRGMHKDFVFVRPNKRRGYAVPMYRMNNSAWQSARERAAAVWATRHGESAAEGFRQVRVHDLKHTFGRRLRAAGVSFEDRQDLLGHRSGRITSHYSKAELSNLIEAAEKVCGSECHKIPTITWIRRKTG
jgi:integrase